MSTYVDGTALSQVRYLAYNQLITRILTFTLNILIARTIGPSYYGLATIQLHLPYTIVLYLCRESIRRASLRYHHKNIQYLINISWFCVLCSIPITIIICNILINTKIKILIKKIHK